MTEGGEKRRRRKKYGMFLLDINSPEQVMKVKVLLKDN